MRGLRLDPDERAVISAAMRRWAPEVDRLAVLQLAHGDAVRDGDLALAEILGDQLERGLAELPPVVRYSAEWPHSMGGLP